jgi:hypothetical protein
MDSWKSVVGFEGVYSVSDVGRVRFDQDRGGWRKIAAGEMVAVGRDLDGYAIAPLSRIGEREKRRSYRVARLVAAAFLGPAPFPKAQVNHKNGIRSDDAVENLEWVTCKENIRHSMRALGRDYRGENSSLARLTAQQVLEIRQLAFEGYTFRDLGKLYGVTNVNIANIARGKTWTNVGGPIIGAR